MQIQFSHCYVVCQSQTHMNQFVTLVKVDNHRMDSDLRLAPGWLDFPLGETPVIFLSCKHTHDFLKLFFKVLWTVNCCLIRSVWPQILTISLWNCFSKTVFAFYLFENFHLLNHFLVSWFDLLLQVPFSIHHNCSRYRYNFFKIISVSCWQL